MTPQWRTVASQFLTLIHARTRSDATRDVYRGILHRWLDTVIDPVEPQRIEIFAFAYGPGPGGQDPAPSTIGNRLSVLDSWYKHLRRLGIADVRLLDDFPRPRRQPTKPGRRLTIEETRQLLAAIPRHGRHLQHRALIVTVLLTGLRRAEVLGLTRARIHERMGTLWISPRLKGGRVTTQELPAPAWSAIDVWLRSRGRCLDFLQYDEPIFTLAGRSFYRGVQRYGKRAGIGHVTPHTLRRTAGELRRSLCGARLEEIQQILHHEDPATTQRYLRSLEGERDPHGATIAAALGLCT